jgi:SpoIIAA-like
MPFTLTRPARLSAQRSAANSASPRSVNCRPAALGAIKRHGKISALFILENFEGWKQSGDWGDITFMTEHDDQIVKIAVVGAEGWRDMIYAFLAKGFRNAQVEYFLPSELAKARSWLEENKRS